LLTIKSYRRDYPVDFNYDIDYLKSLIQEPDCFTIIDNNLIHPYGFEGVLPEGRSYYLDAKEENKTLEEAMKIIVLLPGMSARKKTDIIAIGGGIVQDLACFVSSILYRGVKLTLVPTTLLAQADSCIGSKSSINFSGYKNLIGTFYPPSRILIIGTFLNGLSDKDLFSGLGEIAKIQLMISESNFIDFSNNLEKLKMKDQQTMSRFI